MKNKVSIGFLLFIGALSLFACSQEPEPIKYGTDSCHFCRMTIVDKIHGAEIVTDKGKVYKFDAVECLMNYKKDIEDTRNYLFLSNSFETPGELIKMENAHYLISKKLPSPMGAFLTTFKTKEKIKEIRAQKGGKTYTFEEIEKKFQ